MERIEIQRMEQRELSSALEWPSRDRRRLCQRLFKQHYAKMYRMARTILYDEQESEDVVSDIFEDLLHGQTILMPETEECYLLTSPGSQSSDLVPGAFLFTFVSFLQIPICHRL